MIEDNPTKNLPKNITYIQKHYCIIKHFEKIKYQTSAPTFAIAKQKLIEFELIIQNIKNNKRNEIASREILRNEDGIAIIPLKNKKGDITDYAKVSDEDWHKCMGFPWYKTEKGYVNGIKMLHSFILGKSEDSNHVIDHIDHDKLNNKRENLHFATKSQNAQNTTITDDTKYRGITWRERLKKWEASSGIKYLGSFNDPKEAAKVYDTYTFLKYGKNACTNGLVEYDDVKDLDIETLSKTPSERDLPKNIALTKDNYYEVRIMYKINLFRATLTTLEKSRRKTKRI